MRALCIGREPGVDLGYQYVKQEPYEAVMIGSLTLAELISLSIAPALEALAEGRPVILYTPGLPETPRNRALGATLASRQRELKSWGVIFTDGGRKKLITAQAASALRAAGKMPEPGAVLTPLAKEILEGSQ